MTYTLETYHTEQIGTYTKPITRLHEFHNKQHILEHLFIYKLSDNIGYTLYDISEQEYWDNYDNRYKHIIEQWFDRSAFRGVYNDTTAT